jgi:hypothetical protein
MPSQSTSKTRVSVNQVESLIREKLNKGYKELDLHQPVVIVKGKQSKTVDPRVMGLTDLIMREAGSRISSYLSVTVDALSINQIHRGRAILKQVVDLQAVWQRKGYTISRLKAAERQELLQLVKDFYNTIPTKLPHRIDPDEVVREFMADLSEQEDRLGQLEAGLASYTATVKGSNPLGEVKIKPTAQSSKAYEQIYDYIVRTSGSSVQVKEIFSIHIPGERKAFDSEDMGKDHVVSLFHGTRNPNVRHILRTGLIVPITPSNGRRMGDGVYFSDRSQRSLAYCGGSQAHRMLFVADVALGKIWSTTGTYSGKQAPDGFDSTQGTGAWSGNGDEFVVYRQSQQTIRYLVLLD